MTESNSFHQQPAFRRFGRVNWLGVWTLYVKEVRRFVKILTQTILAPVTTALLFLAIFALAMGRIRADVTGIPFLNFLAPGLVMMSLMQNAFANTSSSLMIAKVQGNIIDVLMPPLSAGEQTFAFALGGITRGLMVAAACMIAIWFFVDFQIMHPLAVIYFALAGAMMMALIGIMGGIWADKFDHIQALTNFVVTPLAFLSGTFYSIGQLPQFAQNIARVNPFFYLIDGFRYGFTGHADSNIMTGVIFTVLLNAVLWMAAYQMFRSGYRLKS
jgi:ABC-2 type transport system permease protein